MPVFLDLNSDYQINALPVLLADMTAVQNKLFNLLRCRLGSRFRQPRYGTRLQELVHEPCDAVTAGEILRDCLDKIREWMSNEIEVVLEATYVVPRATKDGFLIRITFYVPRLQQQGALTFSALR